MRMVAVHTRVANQPEKYLFFTELSTMVTPMFRSTATWNVYSKTKVKEEANGWCFRRSRRTLREGA